MLWTKAIQSIHHINYYTPSLSMKLNFVNIILVFRSFCHLVSK